MSRRAISRPKTVLGHEGSWPRVNEISWPVLTRFEYRISDVQIGPDLAHFTCVLAVSFTPNFAGEMQI